MCRRLLGDDVSCPALSDDVLGEFLNHAMSVNPLASQNRLTATIAIYAAESRGWDTAADGIRKSIAQGIL